MDPNFGKYIDKNGKKVVGGSPKNRDFFWIVLSSNGFIVLLNNKNIRNLIYGHNDLKLIYINVTVVV